VKVIPETRVDRTKLDIYLFVFTDLYLRRNLEIALPVHEMNTLLQQKQRDLKKQSKKQKTITKQITNNQTKQNKAKQNISQ
jgi:high-affinity Fe2+/Pb2+ permease